MKKLRLISIAFSILLFSGCSYDNSDYPSGYPDGGSPYPPGGELNNKPGGKFENYGENPFIPASEEPTSTFSVDSDGASYTVMRSYLTSGKRPPAASVRIEEYLNYFTYDYAEPSTGHNVSLDTEISICPWEEAHYLMRVGLKGKSIPDESLPASNYVFLIDVSGSMSGDDRLEILKKGFCSLVDVLSERDRIGIVTYAGQASVALEPTSCEKKDKIKSVLYGLRAGGSTNGSGGIVEAYRMAEQAFIPGGNNRVILGSDGDFNVGISSTSELLKLIERKREIGVYLTVIGVGKGNLNDAMMEQLANKGNGTYEYVDNLAQMEKVFVHERSKFHTIAKDCKIQVNFDASTVNKYRLIGYENRVMSNEDFDDETADAGEIGAGQTVTALYEIIPVRHGEGTFARVDIRYKTPAPETSLELSGTVSGDPRHIEYASESMRFAVGVTTFGLVYKDSKYAGNASLSLAYHIASGAIGYDPYGYKSEFLRLAALEVK